ncbi:MAG: low molecular weight phosphotyrosine protein phosphatase [Ruminococcaceae bacterium]|nr:low molecular weight phosphotyrosine protein phosphatase [Oscillospiraceae bacterium]
MKKIMFVCLGNICRSPMAEFVMKELVEKKGVAHLFEISSAATCSDELGNPVYPPVRALLSERGISTKGKTACQLSRADYDKYDYFIGMDSNNRRSMLRLFSNDPQGKVSLLMDYTDRPRDVADPWYTRDFKATERDVDEGCAALLEQLLNEN